MAAAQDLCATQHVGERVKSIGNDLQRVDEGVMGLDEGINVVIDGEGLVFWSWLVVSISHQPVSRLGAGHIREELQQVAIDVSDQKRRLSHISPILCRRHSNTLPGTVLQQSLSWWLSPSDPFINYNTLISARHKDTALWFIQGSTFKNWKRSTSLLWIHGKRTYSCTPCPRPY